MLGAQSCITGVGRSAVGRNLDCEPLELAVEACLAAVADAGIDIADVDGLAAFVPDQGSVLSYELQDALGLSVEWYLGVVEGASQLAALWSACMAVMTGQAKHVLAFHASTEGTTRARLGRGGSLPGSAREVPKRVGGERGWWMPFGAPSAANIIGMYAQRHFHEFGTTREQMGQIAVVERENAIRNPLAIYREPMTIEDYLASRMISEPFCLYDCDVPSDFGVAVLVSRDDSVYGLRKPPIKVQTFSTARHGRPSWEAFDDPSTMPLRDAGQALWARTDLTPADVDFAQVYDGFSFIAMTWLEALGFCGRGESGAFIEGGDRIRLGGQLPINTQGGQLSAGRMHGWGLVPEACRQLWDECGDLQVAGAEVGVVASGGGIIGGAALLTR
jgi:acetyl-CoA acetyltransferase